MLRAEKTLGTAIGPKDADVKLDRIFYFNEGDLEVDGVLHSDDYISLLSWRNQHAADVALKFGVIAFAVGCIATTIISLVLR